MGLDQYLSVRQYIGNWDHDDEEERAKCRATLAAVGFDETILDKGSPHVYVEICIGYWRKANQIHGWFVDNVQGGKDECQQSYVEREQLENLRELCFQVRKRKHDATVLMPPTAGFFFGSQAIDEYYWHDIDHTLDVIDKALTKFPKGSGWEFYYRSSW